MPRISIQPAAPADVPELLQLIHGLAEYEKLTHLVECDEGRLSQSLFGVRPYAEALIARLEGHAIAAGFALYFHNFSTFLGKPGIWLEDLYVRPELRSGGVGRRLLRAVAEVAVARDCGRFEWAVLDWNTPAQGFYESLGATVMPDWRIVRVTGSGLRALADGSSERVVVSPKT